jgi:glyoxylase-like metal-dependent hydrolase (beta-lactamase superfamily II)
MLSFAAAPPTGLATRPGNLGSFTIGRVTELEFPAFDALEFFPAATPAMIDEARRALPGRISADGKIVMSFHSFVIKTGRFTIVIDTCCGKPRPGRAQFDHGKRDFLQGLAALNVSPEQVTHVMCTHLHWDHVGWNTRLVDGQWVPTFPQAKYVMAKREYDFWNAAYARRPGQPDSPHMLSFEDSVLPIMRAEKAVLVEDDFELDNGLWLEPCHGHTPGHVVVNVASERQKGVFIGDAVHHPLQLLYPDLSSRADSDMDASRITRRALIEKHAGTGTVVMPQHFSAPSCGTIERAGQAFGFSFIADS